MCFVPLCPPLQNFSNICFLSDCVHPCKICQTICRNFLLVLVLSTDLISELTELRRNWRRLPSMCHPMIIWKNLNRNQFQKYASYEKFRKCTILVTKTSSRCYSVQFQCLQSTQCHKQGYSFLLTCETMPRGQKLNQVLC